MKLSRPRKRTSSPCTWDRRSISASLFAVGPTADWRSGSSVEKAAAAANTSVRAGIATRASGRSRSGGQRRRKGPFSQDQRSGDAPAERHQSEQPTGVEGHLRRVRVLGRDAELARGPDAERLQRIQGLAQVPEAGVAALARRTERLEAGEAGDPNQLRNREQDGNGDSSDDHPSRRVPALAQRQAVPRRALA